MKTLFLLFSSSFLFCISAWGQNVFIEPHFGFGFAELGTTTGIKSASYTYDELDNLYAAEIVHKQGGFGNGVYFGASFGLRLSEILELKIDATFFPQTEESATIKRNYFDRITTEQIFDRVSFLNISPSITLKPNLSSKGKPYMRIGLAAAVPTFERERIFENREGLDFNEVTTYASGFSVGFKSAVGYYWDISERFGFFAEGEVQFLNIIPNISQVVIYKAGDDNLLPSLSESEIFTEYVNGYNAAYTIDANGNQIEDFDPNLPSIAAPFKVPLSNAGIRIGIRLSI